MPLLLRLIAGFLPRRRGCYGGSVHMRFVVHGVTPIQFAFRVIRFPPVCVFPPVHHNRLRLHYALIKGQSLEALETLGKAVLFRKLATLQKEVL